jgi:integrase
MRLTDVGVKRAAVRQTPYRLADGDGLYLLVQPSGAKWWRFDYSFLGARRTISLGTYPAVTLAQARERRRDARGHLTAGKDPSLVKRQERRRAKHAAAQCFEDVALELLDKRRDTVDAGTDERQRTVLRLHVFPLLGSRPVASIEPPDVLDVLQPIDDRGHHDTAHRVKQLCGQILRYAIATGRATRDATADLRGALTPVVPRHHAAITNATALGGLLRAIDALRTVTSRAIALQLAPLVFVRPSELRRAEWTELDFASRLWRIPAAKMKLRDDHLVPLSPQAMALFEAARPYAADSIYVFPCLGNPSRAMSDMTLNAMLRRIGYSNREMTAHGFRATARTLLDEALRFPPDVIEAQLAHTPRGALGDTYNRAKYLEERTRMMSAWADYLDTLKARKP